jgi:hypothetical protein
MFFGEGRTVAGLVLAFSVERMDMTFHGDKTGHRAWFRIGKVCNIVFHWGERPFPRAAIPAHGQGHGEVQSRMDGVYCRLCHRCAAGNHIAAAESQGGHPCCLDSLVFSQIRQVQIFPAPWSDLFSGCQGGSTMADTGAALEVNLACHCKDATRREFLTPP